MTALSDWTDSRVLLRTLLRTLLLSFSLPHITPPSPLPCGPAARGMLRLFQLDNGAVCRWRSSPGSSSGKHPPRSRVAARQSHPGHGRDRDVETRRSTSKNTPNSFQLGVLDQPSLSGQIGFWTVSALCASASSGNALSYLNLN